MNEIAQKRKFIISNYSLLFAFSKIQPKRQFLKVIASLLAVIGLVIALILVEALVNNPTHTIDIFVGLSIGYGDEQTALEQIDKVASYVNLIILGSLDVTTDTKILTRVCDHIYQKGLNFILYVAFGGAEDAPPRGPNSQFFINAKAKYGDKFLGVYLFDEVGGKLMDGAHSINVTDAKTYTDAAILYTHHLNFYLGNVSNYYAPAQFPLYTSDYALYWYDYLSGYDTVFTEYIGNQSRQIATGLCRGAAKALGKEWGVIITWSGQPEPFVENPDQLYSDMVLAYQNGAKYITVFNSPGNFTPPTRYGTLTPEHFEKMQQFWNYAHLEPPADPYPAKTAFVLPRDYGYGFRGQDDKIWGKWKADSLSPQIWNDVQELLKIHVLSLDIVYETKIANENINLPYNRLIFWNGTIIQK
jgi:hypothetical protein